jgi:hypothetical protein
MNEHSNKPDRSTSPADTAANRTDKKQQRPASTKVPPDNQHTPGEGGEKSGGGLQGA